MVESGVKMWREAQTRWLYLTFPSQQQWLWLTPPCEMLLWQTDRQAGERHVSAAEANGDSPTTELEQQRSTYGYPLSLRWIPCLESLRPAPRTLINDYRIPFWKRSGCLFWTPGVDSSLIWPNMVPTMLCVLFFFIGAGWVLETVRSRVWSQYLQRQ